MRKISLLLLAMLVSAVALSAAPKPTLGSVGNIYINVEDGPSPVVAVQAGGTVKLNFAGVTFSGGQVRLYFSRDGSSALDTANDKAYGPTFVVAHIRAETWDNDTTYKGYSVGYNWIVGSIPKEYAGGEWYIKAYDGQTSSVAVTDRPLTVTCLLEVEPTSGPGQAAITLKGWGFSTASGNHVNLSYYITEWKSIVNFLAVDANGQFTYSMTAPDAGKVLPKGENTVTTIAVIFEAKEKTGSDDVTFLEYYRGLIQVKGPTENCVAGTGSLYGNNTDFAQGALIVNAKVLGALIIAGNYFHPGTVTIKWDATTVVGTTTANGTGFFNITITVPITNIGAHNIIIDDTKIKFNISVYVVPTLVLTPNKGVPCENVLVTAEGYGFTASTDSVKYHVNVTWYYLDWGTSETKDLVTKLLVDTNGYWKFTFTLPHAHGGDNTVVAVENDTLGTVVYAIFTVLPGVKITPSTFPNNGTIVTITGCGLKYECWYDLLIDNVKDFYAADSSGLTIYFMDSGKGDFSLELIAAGFDEEIALHSVALYELKTPEKLPKLVAWTTFTVTSEAETAIMDKLDEIANAISQLDAYITSSTTGLPSIKTLVTAVQSAVADAKSALSTQISGLSTQLTSITTYAQDAATKATSASTSAASAASAAAAAKTAAEGAQSATATISTAVYGAIVLSLIAALASIVAVITLQKKVA
ncbi:hypothetical protein KEJ18_05735 [Candidatus Bathyarchaeota archaeon]|nr:hypothetical protein [Candidatus Bathyarchaeota archaeon]